MDFMDNYQLRIDKIRRVLVFEEIPQIGSNPAGHDKNWWKINFHRFTSMKNGWKQYLDKLNKSDLTTSSARKKRDAAKKQYKEVSKLYTKLERYANRHSVPMHWRK
jgi:hypothetical protein